MLTITLYFIILYISLVNLKMIFVITKLFIIIHLYACYSFIYFINAINLFKFNYLFLERISLF